MISLQNYLKKMKDIDSYMYIYGMPVENVRIRYEERGISQRAVGRYRCIRHCWDTGPLGRYTV